MRKQADRGARKIVLFVTKKVLTWQGCWSILTATIEYGPDDGQERYPGAVYYLGSARFWGAEGATLSLR